MGGVGGGKNIVFKTFVGCLGGQEVSHWIWGGWGLKMAVSGVKRSRMDPVRDILVLV